MIKQSTKEEFTKLSQDCVDIAEYWDCLGVLFSATKKGEAIVVHVACEKSNIRNLRAGCRDFINHMFFTYTWCKMLIATVSIKNRSVHNLCLKLGFKDCGVYCFEQGAGNIMVVEKCQL